MDFQYSPLTYTLWAGPFSRFTGNSIGKLRCSSSWLTLRKNLTFGMHGMMPISSQTIRFMGEFRLRHIITNYDYSFLVYT